MYVKNADGTFEEVSAFLLNGFASAIKKTSIDDAVSQYLATCTSKKCKKNQNNELLTFKKFKNYLSDYKISSVDEITRMHIDVLESILLEYMCESSVNRRFSTLRNFFRMCEE